MTVHEAITALRLAGADPRDIAITYTDSTTWRGDGERVSTSMRWQVLCCIGKPRNECAQELAQAVARIVEGSR